MGAVTWPGLDEVPRKFNQVSITIPTSPIPSPTTATTVILLTIAMLRGVWLLSILLPLLPGIKADGSLYPPGLMPLITHANSLISAGKFGDAASAYSQAIGESNKTHVFGGSSST